MYENSCGYLKKKIKQNMTTYVVFEKHVPVSLGSLAVSLDAEY